MAGRDILASEKKIASLLELQLVLQLVPPDFSHWQRRLAAEPIGPKVCTVRTESPLTDL